MEIIMEDVLVEQIDVLLRTEIRNRAAWAKITASINNSIESAGPLLSRAFGCRLDPLSTDEFCERICETLASHLGISLNEDLVRVHVSPMCQCVDPSELLVAAVCRSSLAGQLLGTTLPKRLRVAMHCEAFGVELPEMDRNVADDLLQELETTRAELIRAQAAKHVSHVMVGELQGNNLNADEGGLAAGVMLETMYAKPTTSDIRTRIQLIESTLRNNVALKNAPNVFSDAFNLMCALSPIDDDSMQTALSKLVSRQALCTSMLHLETALDELLKEEIFKELHYCSL